MRLIEKLSPNSDAGGAGKMRLSQRLCDALSGARAEEILRLRNLQLSAFPEPKRVWNALATWVGKNSYAQDQDTQMLSVLDRTPQPATPLSRNGEVQILNGLAAAARSAKSSFPRAFWRWTKNAVPKSSPPCSPMFRPKPKSEERLARAMPLHSRSNNRRDPRASSPCLAAGFVSTAPSFRPAPHRRMPRAGRSRVDTDPIVPRRSAGGSATREAQRELVECALDIEDPRMAPLAGEAVAKDPKVLAGLDLTADRGAGDLARSAGDRARVPGKAQPIRRRHFIRYSTGSWAAARPIQSCSNNLSDTPSRRSRKLSPPTGNLVSHWR